METLTSQLIQHPDRNSGHCRIDKTIRSIKTLPFYLTLSIPHEVIQRTFLFLSASNLPVEFGAFDKRVGVPISNEHFTAHASEAFRVVLLLSSNLFIQGGSVVKHNAEAMGIIIFTR